jgi:hypothetical protein
MKEGFSRRRSASKKTGGIGRCRLAHLQSCAEQLRSLFARNSSLSCVPVQFSKLFSRLPPVKDHRPSRSITLPKCANNSIAKINFKKKNSNAKMPSLAYQPPASSTFLSEQTSHQQSASSTFLSEQTSTSHQPPAKRTGCKLPTG